MHLKIRKKTLLGGLGAAAAGERLGRSPPPPRARPGSTSPYRTRSSLREARGAPPRRSAPLHLVALVLLHTPLSTPRMTSRSNCKLQAAARRPRTPSLHPLLLAGCRFGWRKLEGEGESNQGNEKTEGGKSGHGSRGSFCGVHPRAL